MPTSRPATPPPLFPLASRLAVEFRHEERIERIVVACAAQPLDAELVRPGAEWLGPHEDRHAQELKFAKRRDEYLLGRYVAKSALVEWLGDVSPGELDIVPGAFQQPVVHGRVSRPAGVTLTHTAGRAIAIAHELGHPFGVDLERHDPARVDVVRTQVAAAELPPETTLAESERYFLLWAAKEALSKALRCGLTCPFELLAVTGARIDADGICTGTFANFGQYKFFAWMLGPCTFAVAGAKRADFAPVLPALLAFTRARFAGSAPA